MSPQDQILAEALKLPQSVRAEIAETLIRSLDDAPESKEPGYDRAWAEDLDARLKSIADSTAVLIASDEVLDHIRDRVRRAGQESHPAGPTRGRPDSWMSPRRN